MEVAGWSCQAGMALAVVACPEALVLTAAAGRAEAGTAVVATGAALAEARGHAVGATVAVGSVGAPEVATEAEARVVGRAVVRAAVARVAVKEAVEG